MVRVSLSVRPRVTLRLLSESVEPSTSSLVLTHDSELLPDFGVVEPISRLSQCLQVRRVHRYTILRTPSMYPLRVSIPLPAEAPSGDKIR